MNKMNKQSIDIEELDNLERYKMFHLLVGLYDDDLLEEFDRSGIKLVVKDGKVFFENDQGQRLEIVKENDELEWDDDNLWYVVHDKCGKLVAG